MTAKVDTYCDIYLFSTDKLKAMESILSSILVDIKNTLVKEKISSYAAHGNVLVLFHIEWTKIVFKINSIEKKQVLTPEGLLLALVKMFPLEMPLIYRANTTIKKLMDGYAISVKQ